VCRMTPTHAGARHVGARPEIKGGGGGAPQVFLNENPEGGRGRKRTGVPVIWAPGRRPADRRTQQQARNPAAIKSALIEVGELLRPGLVKIKAAVGPSWRLSCAGIVVVLETSAQRVGAPRHRQARSEVPLLVRLPAKNGPRRGEQLCISPDNDLRRGILLKRRRVNHLRHAELVSGQAEISVARKERGEPPKGASDVEHLSWREHMCP